MSTRPDSDSAAWTWERWSYWSNNGRYQDLSDQLNRLVPAMGEVDDHRNNPKLERFRKASNAYYDLYNNGGGNRRQAIYGFTKVGSANNWDGCARAFEPVMDKIILEAAAEQIGKLALPAKPKYQYRDEQCAFLRKQAW